MEYRSRFDELMRQPPAFKKEIAGSDYELLANAYEAACKCNKGLIIKGDVGIGKTHFASQTLPNPSKCFPMNMSSCSSVGVAE